MRHYTRKPRKRRVLRPGGRLDSTHPVGNTRGVSRRDPKRLGDEVRRIRSQAGMSQEEFAARGKLGLATVQRIEQGLIKPRPQTLAKLDEAVGRESGWAYRVLEGHDTPAADVPAAEASPDEPTPEPLSFEWWNALSKQLSPGMFEQVSEMINMALKAQAERRRDVDGA